MVLLLTRCDVVQRWGSQPTVVDRPVRLVFIVLLRLHYIGTHRYHQIDDLVSPSTVGSSKGTESDRLEIIPVAAVKGQIGRAVADLRVIAVIVCQTDRHIPKWEC